MKLRLELTAAAFLAAYQQQFTKGGVLVPGDPPAGITLFQAAELELVIDATAPVVLPAQVVQMFAGVGVALAVDAKHPLLLAALEKSRTQPAAAASTPAAAPARPKPAAVNPGLAAAAKIKLALHGDRDERAAILRDTNRSLHMYLLKNPAIGLDEIAQMARTTSLAPDALKTIAERREWISRPEIAIALVRNHAVPIPLALRALEHVSPAELRNLAKDTRAREPIVRAARKKVVG